MKAKIFDWLLIAGIIACTAICLSPESTQNGQVNIPLYRIEQQQQELNARGHELVIDGKFGRKTTDALNDELKE